MSRRKRLVAAAAATSCAVSQADCHESVTGGTDERDRRIRKRRRCGEPILRFSHLQSHGDCAISLTWPTSRTGAYRQLVLRSLTIIKNEAVRMVKSVKSIA